jgi:hypothetical protein
MKPSRCFRIKPIEDKKILSFLLSAQKNLAKFFGIKMPIPHVFIVSSRKDINAIFGRKTKNWIVAWIKKGTIFALDQAAYRKESNHKDPRYFWKVLKHEYCHLYFEKFTSANFPKWLNEGLACYLARQEKYPPPKGKLLNILRYHKKSDQWVYAVGYFWVNLLIKKFGKAKLLKLLRGLHANTSKKEFDARFHRIYGFRFDRGGLKGFAKCSQKLPLEQFYGGSRKMKVGASCGGGNFTTQPMSIGLRSQNPRF